MKQRANLLIILGLAILCAIAYSNSFYKNFQYDDVRLIRFNFALRDPAHMKAIFSFEPFRSLSTVSYAIDFAISGKETTSYHVTNILLHFCNVTVFFLLLRRLSDNVVFGAIAAALMAVHPLNTESVTYIAGRSILLCALFYLLSLYAFDSFLRSGRKYFLLLFSLLFLLALLSKEEAAVIPFAALLYNFLFSRESLRKHRLFHFVTIGFVLLAGTLRIVSHLRFTPEPFAIPLSVYWPTQMYVWLQYLWLTIFPVHLNVNHEVTPLHVYSPPFFISLAILFSLLAALVFAASRWSKLSLLTFFGLWFFVNLLPSSILPLTHFMAEHRIYISLFGFCAALAYLVIAFQKASGKNSFVITAVLLLQIFFYIGVTMIRNNIWHDEITLWTDSLEKAPHSVTTRMNLAGAYMHDFQFHNAAKQYLYVISRGLPLPGAYSGLGYCFLNEKDFEEAEKNFEEALFLDPLFTDAKTGLGIVAYEQNRCHDALNYFDQVYEQRRESVDLLRMMAECSMKTGDYESAIRYIKKGIAIDPSEHHWKKQLHEMRGITHEQQK